MMMTVPKRALTRRLDGADGSPYTPLTLGLAG
jgi:hypothetical protein